MRAWVRGLGLRCALGSAPAEVLARLAAGESAVRAHPDLWPLRDGRAARVEGLELRPWLRHPKDAKLMARPACLALPAAGDAISGFSGDRQGMGLFLGVGAEPPDGGDSEGTLLAAERDGRLDEARLAGPGRALYPPLLPLRTLPNMALAHLSIQLGVGGANGAWTGRADASLRAIAAALWALSEGRCPVALAGGTDSLSSLPSARDLRRLDWFGPPGEAAALLLMDAEPVPGAVCLRGVEGGGDEALAVAHRQALGACGAADGALALLLLVARVQAGGEGGRLPLGESEAIEVAAS